MSWGASVDHSEPDIVLVVLQRVQAQAPAVTDEVLRLVESEVRAEYGGLRVRIPKRKKHLTAQQREAVRVDAMTPASDAEITRAHGISRASLYRYVKHGS